MFNNTIDLGSLLSIGAFFVAIVIYLVGGRSDMKVLEARLIIIDAQMEDFKLEMKKFGEIIVEQTRQEGRINNVEARMLMEGQRIDAMENTFRDYLVSPRRRES
jgi:hypothetical protein